MPAREVLERRLTAGGFGTRALEIKGDGPPLLLLHGYSDRADTWRPLMRKLAEQGQQAIAVDMPGFGHADRREPGPIMPQLDSFVAALVRDHLGPSPILVGNSMGGAASLRAAQDPELGIAGIVPISPAGLKHDRWVTLLERDPVVNVLARTGAPIPPAIVRRAATFVYGRLACAQPSLVDRGAVAAYVSQFKTRGDAVRLIRNARILLPELRDGYELGRITCPVLMIWGKRDRLVPWTGSQVVLDQVPGSRLVVLERAGHCSQVEEPGRIADLILEFAADQRGGATRHAAPQATSTAASMASDTPG